MIRRVNSAGIISRFAGTTATIGNSGDGGAATTAELNFPTGVSADSSGNVFVADNGNHIVRKISTTGIISTLAGNDTAG
ncbi:MAG: hypothetical protein H7257_05025 [Taibaiella sp.]|nr:hypothetical protein [Taibaiella sp.]